MIKARVTTEASTSEAPQQSRAFGSRRTERLGIALVALGLVLSLACRRGEDRGEEGERGAERIAADGAIRMSDQERKSLGLVVEVVSRAGFSDAALRFGRVLARPGDEAIVVAPVAGRIIVPARVRPGDVVRPGAVICAIVPALGAADQLALKVDAAETSGAVEAAERTLELRQSEAERARTLASSKIVSTAKLQQAEAELAEAQARLEALRRARAVQERASAEVATEIRSPAGGTIGFVEAPLGALVNAGDLIARVLREGPRWIDVAVPPEDVAGDGYEVELGRGWLPARLLSRGAMVADDGFRHDRLELDAAAGIGLAPGSAVSVHVLHGVGDGIVIPESALVPGASADSVYVEVRAGEFIRRPVRVTLRNAGRARVEDGLREGEKIVTQGAMALEGERLRSRLDQED